MKILVIDNNVDRDCWGAGNLVQLAASVTGASVFVRRGLAGDLPATLTPYDRIIVSGSRMSCLEKTPASERLDDLIRQSVERGKPLLGVCYGHQALIRALGGQDAVRRGKTPEFGWTKIEVLEPSTLFKDLPQPFYSFSSHFEEAAQLPTGIRLLARSERCAIQACVVEGKPIFGIQFHPEKDFADGEKIIKEERKQNPSALVNPDRGTELFNPKIGEIIFRNFLTS